MGNTDIPFWEDDLPWEAEVEVLGLRILVCHIGKSLMGRHDPVAEGFDLVISGHSHMAAVEWREDTLFLNPGRGRQGPLRRAAHARAGERSGRTAGRCRRSCRWTDGRGARAAPAGARRRQRARTWS